MKNQRKQLDDITQLIQSVNANNASRKALENYCCRLKEEIEKLKTLDSLNALDDKSKEYFWQLFDRKEHIEKVLGIKKIAKLKKQELFDYYKWLFESEKALRTEFRMYDFFDSDNPSLKYKLEIIETLSILIKQLAYYDQYLIAEKMTPTVIGNVQYYKVGDRFMQIDYGMEQTYLSEKDLKSLIEDFNMNRNNADFEILNSEVVEKILSNGYQI